ncbi:unnamed protein product [Parajaminaea phylloscopi]
MAVCVGSSVVQKPQARVASTPTCGPGPGSMSLDLDWSLLDATLADQLLAKLNKSLSKATRPDFIGPISLTSLDFGDDCPDVRITGVGDVWRGFAEASKTSGSANPSRSAATKDRSSALGRPRSPDDEVGDVDLEDVHDHRQRHDARRDVPRTYQRTHRPSEHLTRLAEQSLPFTGPGVVGPRLQTFRQYTPSDIQQVSGGPGSLASFPASIPHWANGGSGSVSGSGLTTPAWGGAGLGPRALVPVSGHHTASGYFSPWHASTPPTPHGAYNRPTEWRRSSSFAFTNTGLSSGRDGRSPPVRTRGDGRLGDGAAGAASTSSNGIPSLQMQMSVVWSTNTIKLSINTSLLVNHPTPAFLELPLNVSVIGLGVQAGVVVAFEDGDGDGDEGRKVHISLIEDEECDESTGEDDPSEGAGAGARGDNDATAGVSGSASSASVAGAAPAGTTASLAGPKATLAPPAAHGGLRRKSINDRSSPARTPPPQRALTVGERLLPHITLESSVGQAEKHVLRNVGKVEKFLIELIRKAVEDELVWPNFYTLALPAS